MSSHNSWEKMSVKLRFHLVLPPQHISHFLHTSVEARAPTDVMFDFYTCADETHSETVNPDKAHPPMQQGTVITVTITGFPV